MSSVTSVSVVTSHVGLSSPEAARGASDARMDPVSEGILSMEHLSWCLQKLHAIS